MFRRLFSTSAFALCVFSSLCLAQPATDGGDKGGDQPQGEREGGRRRFRAEGGERGEGRRGPGGRRGFQMQRFDPKAELAQMTEKLKLDEAQQASIGKLLEEHQAQMEAQREKMRPSDEERAKMDSMREEMQAAREAGDDAKMQELRGKMREAMGGRMEEMRKTMEANQKTLHDGIESQLREDQKADFSKMWQERMQQRGPRGQGGPDRGPAALKSIVDKLDDLTADQKQQIKTVFENFQEANKDKSGPPSPEVGRKLHEDIFAILTDGQKAKVEKALEGQRGRRDREGRPRRQRGNDEPKDEGV